MYKAVLFDLDGTITKPESGIYKSLYYVAKTQNLTLPPEERLKEFIGPPLQLSFMKFFGADAQESERLVACYREYYTVNGVLDCELFDGTENMIKTLHGLGVKILLATSKPQPLAEATLQHFDLLKYFYGVCGAGVTLENADKSLIVSRAIAASGENECDIIMVGDREYDVIGANNNGIKSLGVLYGYGTRDELEKAGATYIAETPYDVLKFIGLN